MRFPVEPANVLPAPLHGTAYFSNELGGPMIRVEGRILEHGRTRWAQYPAAPYVVIIPKGKRTPRVRIETFQPYLVIVRGAGPLLRPPTTVISADATVEVSTYRHSGFSAGWRSEADEVLASARGVIVADYREVHDQRPAVRAG